MGREKAKQPPVKIRKARRNTRLNPELTEKLAPIMNQSEIARLQGVAPSTVMRYLRKHEIACSIEDLEKDLGRDLLLLSRKNADLLHRLVDYFRGMDGRTFAKLPDHIKKSLMDAANNAMGTAFDKYRLQVGKATSITEGFDIVLQRIEMRLNQNVPREDRPMREIGTGNDDKSTGTATGTDPK